MEEEFFAAGAVTITSVACAFDQCRVSTILDPHIAATPTLFGAAPSIAVLKQNAVLVAVLCVQTLNVVHACNNAMCVHAVKILTYADAAKNALFANVAKISNVFQTALVVRIAKFVNAWGDYAEHVVNFYPLVVSVWEIVVETLGNAQETARRSSDRFANAYAAFVKSVIDK